MEVKMSDMKKLKKLSILLFAFPLTLTSCFVARDSGQGSAEDDPTPIEPERYFDVEDEEGADSKDYDEIKTLTTSEIKDKVLGGWIGHVIGLGSGFEYVIAMNKEGKYLYGDANTKNATSGEHTITYTGEAGTIKGLYFDNSIIGLDDEYFETDGNICTGSLGSNRRKLAPVSEPRVISGNVFSDDDINVDVLNQFIFRDYGPLLSNKDIADAWKYYDVHDLGGGKFARQVMDVGYIAPFTGTAQYGNEAYWNTEGWIENETLGLLFPYMYESCLSYADMFTHLQSDADTTYLGMLSALMYSLAFEYSDTKIIMEKAFNYLPHSNLIYEMYQFVKGCYESDVNNHVDLNVAWRETCLQVANKYELVTNHCGDNDRVGYSINACAGMIFTSLFYGRNDFTQTLKIVSLCGLDGDCTAATVGGLMGTIYGYDNLPEKYKKFLNKDSYYCNVTPHNVGTNDGHISQCHFIPDFGYMDKHFPNTISFNELANLTIQNMQKIVVAFGGSVFGSNINILKQPVRNSSNTVDLVNYSFENGNTDGWTFRGEGGSSLNVVEAIAECHLGKKCGVIHLGEIDEGTKNTGEAYQTLNLVKDHKYTFSIWLKGGSDREAHLFARDFGGTQYRSVVNNRVSEGAYAKHSFTFIATSASMEVGIKYPESYEDALSNVIYIDDAQIVDVTTSKQKLHRIGYEFEELDCTGAIKKKNIKYSNGTAAKFEGDNVSEATLDLDGLSGIKTFKIYYFNVEEDYAQFLVRINNFDVTFIDLLPTGINNDYSHSNCFEFTIYIDESYESMTLRIIDGITYMDGIVIEDAYRGLVSNVA